MHTNQERAAALLRAERRVQEREKWLEGEQQELDQTRDRVSRRGDVLIRLSASALEYYFFVFSGMFFVSCSVLNFSGMPFFGWLLSAMGNYVLIGRMHKLTLGFVLNEFVVGVQIPSELMQTLRQQKLQNTPHQQRSILYTNGYVQVLRYCR